MLYDINKNTVYIKSSANVLLSHARLTDKGIKQARVEVVQIPKKKAVHEFVSIEDPSKVLSLDEVYIKCTLCANLVPIREAVHVRDRDNYCVSCAHELYEGEETTPINTTVLD